MAYCPSVDGGGHPGYGSEELRAAVARGGDNLLVYLGATLFFGIPGVHFGSIILLIVAALTSLLLALTIRERLRNR